ncbi:hypothetical protein FRX31_028065 [Thalictrum thalictroides]|uniref:Reverse transcriptase zinc-binding domain-containing protein n=1 Tax=Thalictrum thalictroides TaxID=46969 RepID=A0A7J6VB92_THATH|nr:hypothetical protein FRX31_028065 [Thalictrum thalictroides]
MQIPEDCSWIWHGILQTREQAKKFTRVQIADGKNTNILHDPWIETGILNELITRRKRRGTGLREGDQVEKLIINGQWALPPTTNPATRDMARTYAVYRDRGSNQDWTKVPWNHFYMPRHSFVTWLAMQGRLTPQDKLKEWGRTTDSVHVLCSWDHHKAVCYGPLQWRSRYLVTEIHAEKLGFEQITFRHVFRESNKAADWPAVLGESNDPGNVFCSPYPRDFSVILAQDASDMIYTRS